MAEIAVREAAPEDAPMLSLLFIELDEHHFHLAPAEFLQLDGPARNLETVENIINSDTGVVLVAVEAASDRILGFAHVLRREVPSTIVSPARRVAEIDTFAVTSTARRAGVGAALLNGVEDWARTETLQVLELGVREFNSSALSFYEAAGFRTASRRLRRPVGPPL